MNTPTNNKSIGDRRNLPLFRFVFCTALVCALVAGLAGLPAAIDTGFGIRAWSEESTDTSLVGETPSHHDNDVEATRTTEPVSPTISLARHNFTLGPEITLELAFHIRPDPPDPGELLLTVSPGLPILRKSSLNAVASGTERPGYRGATTLPLGGLPRLTDGSWVARLEAGSTQGAPLTFPTDGVYPLLVQLRSATDIRADPISSFETWVVYLARPGSARLALTTVMPFESKSPGTDLDGRPTDEFQSDISPSGRLGELAQFVDDSQIPITLAPTPATISDLAAVSAGQGQPAEDADAIISKLARSARRPGSEMLALPWAAPPSQLYADSRLGSDLDAQVRMGSETLSRILGDPGTKDIQLAPDGPLNPSVLQRMVDHGVSRLIIREDALEPVAGVSAYSQPYVLRAESDTVEAISPRPEASALLDQVAVGGAPATYRLMAELAIYQFEADGTPRATVLKASRDVDPNGEGFALFLEAVLDASSWLTPASLDAVFDNIPRAQTARRTPLIRQAIDDSPGQLPQGAEVLRMTRRVDSFSTIPTSPNPLPRRLSEHILRSESAWLSAGGGAAAMEVLSETDRRLEFELAQIVLPKSTGITLTSREGVIPLRIENTAGYEVAVYARLHSEKLRFEGGGDELSIVVPPPGATEEIEVLVASTGVFPMDVALYSPDGGLLIASESISIRSTGASSLALVLTAAAAGFLAIWWGRELYRSRRGLFRRSTS